MANNLFFNCYVYVLRMFTIVILDGCTQVRRSSISPTSRIDNDIISFSRIYIIEHND